MPPRSHPERPLRPGDFVRVHAAASSRWAGRTGLCVAADERKVLVRFGPAKPYEFATQDLARVLGGVR